MADILEIIEIGHPELRRVAQPVLDILDDRIQKLVQNLLATMADSSGVGIAAPQVAESLRLIVVASRPNPRYPKAPLMEPLVMINPTIVAHSQEQIKDWEGCLSVPGIRGLIPRYQAIEVSFLGQDGRSYQREFTDFVARIIQHEIDHLDGLVFLDRVETNQDLISNREYLKRIAAL